MISCEWMKTPVYYSEQGGRQECWLWKYDLFAIQESNELQTALCYFVHRTM